jgi:hypothetical protein
METPLWFRFMRIPSFANFVNFCMAHAYLTPVVQWIFSLTAKAAALFHSRAQKHCYLTRAVRRREVSRAFFAKQHLYALMTALETKRPQGQTRLIVQWTSYNELWKLSKPLKRTYFRDKGRMTNWKELSDNDSSLEKNDQIDTSSLVDSTDQAPSSSTMGHPLI